MRLVVDTNVLASALIRPQGRTGEVLRSLRNGGFALIYSVPSMIELVDVLSRPRIQQKYHIHPEDITALINLMRLRGELVDPKEAVDACKDPSDNRVLEAAVEGLADAIVTGDQDLLDLREFRSIPILRVVELLARL